MKLLGFEGHDITSMNYETIDENELQKILENAPKSDEEGNIFIDEEVEIKIAKDLNKTLINGTIVIIDIEGYRKITIKIVGEFSFDNEGATDPNSISDAIFRDFWPVLRRYIPPAVSTITSITTRGELELKF